MKKIIPFSKDLMFKTKINEITSIAIDNTLKLEDNLVSGEFLINGTYKMIENGNLDEEFKYSIPVDITIDSKYDTSNCYISIDDFTYEQIDKVNRFLKAHDFDLECTDGAFYKVKFKGGGRLYFTMEKIDGSWCVFGCDHKLDKTDIT